MALLFSAIYGPALDSNGNPLSGATWTFYHTETTTLASVYADADLSVALENPVEADISGVFVPVYLNESVTYRAVLASSGGQTILEIDPVNPATSVLATAAAVADVAATAAALDVRLTAAEAGNDTLAADIDAEEAARAAADTTLQDQIDEHGNADVLGVTVRKKTKALLDADLAHASGTLAFVYGDATGTNNGLYEKQGASGAGSWERQTLTYQAAVDEVQALVDDAEAAAAAAAASASSLTGVAELFEDASSDNLYDPAEIEPTNNYNPSGSKGVGGLSYYAASGLIPCTPGTQYWMSLQGTNAQWTFASVRVNFYNSDTASSGALVSSSTAGVNGVAFSNGNRLVTFVPPATTTHFGINFAGTTGTSPSAGEFEALAALTMLNTGAAALSFAPYVEPGSKVFPDYVINPDGGVVLVKSGTDVYVRHPLWSSLLYDVVRKLEVGSTASASESGAVDFKGARRIPRATTAENTLAAFNASTVIYTSGGDESPPHKLNNMYLGGNHGIAGSFKLTKAGHGRTDTNVGEVGTDGAAKSWVLTKIVDADNIWVTAANTGTATSWTISGVVTGTTIAFPSGDYTFTASAGVLGLPLLQNYAVEILVDDEAVTDDGTYTGDSATIHESYGIPNAASVLAALIAAAGTGTPPAFNDAGIQTQVKKDHSWRFDRYGACLGVTSNYDVQAYTRVGGGSYDYYGAQQYQLMVRTGTDTLNQYVPEVATTGGYAFRDIANITSNAASVVVARSACDDPTNPASHFAQIIKSSGGVAQRGFAHGYSRRLGVGVPAVRAAKTTNVWQLTPSEKQYPVAVDVGAGGTATAGAVETTVTWNAYYEMVDNPTYTVNVLYEERDKVVWVFDAHATLDHVWIAMPKDLIGKPATVIDGGMTLHTDAVMGSGLMVSTSGGFGRAVVEIG